MSDKVIANMRDPIQKYCNAMVAGEDLQIARTVHEFVEKEVKPLRLDLDGGFHRDQAVADKAYAKLSQGLVDLGLMRAFFPKEYGGSGLTSLVTGCIIEEELGRGDQDLAERVFLPPWAFTGAFITNNETVLKRFAPLYTGNEFQTSCLAITESGGGCNLEDLPGQHGQTIQTIAELKGNEWIINGQKMWPGIIIDSPFYSTICTTDPKKGEDGICVIDVPKETPGLSFGKPEELCGRVLATKNGAIFYDNVRVPKEYCSGHPGGEGAYILKNIITTGRFPSAAEVIGGAQACLEIVEDYLKDRYIAGKPVRERSLFAARIGEMAMRLQAARSYYLDVAYKCDHPEIYGDITSPQQIARSSACKNFGTEVGEWVMREAMGLLGAYGYSRPLHIERYLRDSYIARIWEGGVDGCYLDAAQGEYQYNPW